MNQPLGSGMRRRFGMFTIIAVMLASISHASFAAVIPAFGGEWQMRMTDTSERYGLPTVHVMLMTPGLNTFYVDLGKLEGLSREAFDAADAPVTFKLRRDAGTFDFTGTFRNGRGNGRFVFTADPAFSAELVRRGVGRPTPEQHFSLGRHDVTLRYLDELAAQQYATPSVALLDKLGMSSVDVTYIREMAAAGYRLGTADQLLRLSDNSVTPRYIRELAELGYSNLSPNDLVHLQSMSVTVDVARDANARAGRKLSVAELIRMRANADDDGVTDTERRAKARKRDVTGEGDLSTPYTGRWVISDVRNNSARLEYLWDDDTNWDRWIPLSEFQDLDASLMGPGRKTPTSFRIEQDAGRFDFVGSLGAGRGTGTFRFTPDRAFVDTLRSLGIRELDTVTDHSLKNLAWGSMSTAYVRGFQKLGFTRMSLEDLQGLAIRQVTPQYVEAMRAVGVTGTDDIDRVVDLRFADVPVEFVKELAAIGYRHLTVRELLDLRSAHVTPDFIRELQKSTGTLPSVESVLEARAETRSRERARPRTRTRL